MADTMTPVQKQSILVVDDTPANLRLLHKLLGGEGYDVRVAPSGDLALRSVHEAPPDLVLLDVVMPRMDGFAVCRALKADPTTRDIPVIFVSALGDTEQKLQAFDVGGVDYVTKPFQSTEVLARVRVHLDLLRHRRELQTLNLKLQRSNQELEQFAQVAAHDLKGPLQGIVGFAELLILTVGAQVSEEAREHLAFIANRAIRMSDLIDNLLRYARLSTDTVPLEPVDLKAVATEVCADLDARIVELGGRVEIGELPWVKADETQMWQLFENLIANALKFHRPGCPPVVELHSTSMDRVASISVRDHGIGFDDSDKDKVFQIFRRLPDHSTYDGVGIGLAVCKKIVERHGGSIDASSKQGRGATFTFTLPLSKPPSALG